jgi:hypothetical protein
VRRRGRGAFEAPSALGVYGGQVSSRLKRGAWSAEGEDLGGLCLDKWDYANVLALAEYAQRPRMLFFNYIQAAHDTVIKDPKPENGAALAQKYKGIRLYDDEDYKTYRVRTDRAEFVGKKQGGWALLCDKMPFINPASDPEGDYDYAWRRGGARIVNNQRGASLHDQPGGAGTWRPSRRPGRE